MWFVHPAKKVEQGSCLPHFRTYLTTWPPAFACGCTCTFSPTGWPAFACRCTFPFSPTTWPAYACTCTFSPTARLAYECTCRRPPWTKQAPAQCATRAQREGGFKHPTCPKHALCYNTEVCVRITTTSCIKHYIKERLRAIKLVQVEGLVVPPRVTAAAPNSVQYPDVLRRV